MHQRQKISTEPENILNEISHPSALARAVSHLHLQFVAATPAKQLCSLSGRTFMGNSQAETPEVLVLGKLKISAPSNWNMQISDPCVESSTLIQGTSAGLAMPSL